MQGGFRRVGEGLLIKTWSFRVPTADVMERNMYLCVYLWKHLCVPYVGICISTASDIEGPTGSRSVSLGMAVSLRHGDGDCLLSRQTKWDGEHPRTRARALEGHQLLP